jgi:uncharacterized protein YndB with AHSA1/START domain
MSVKVDPSGRRSVQTELEVAGTPEQVWDAIATGPGIGCWFVPADFEQRDGKPVAVTYHFSPEMDIRGTVTAWDPPRTFAAQGAGWTPESPPMASEWTIEAHAGGTCTLRIVHSLFASTDDWDFQLEGSQEGWIGFLNILRIYLAHFRVQTSAVMQVTTPVAVSEGEAWETLTTALGLKGAGVGDTWSTAAGDSPLAGVVELLTETPYDALIRLDTPTPGIAALGAVTYPSGDQVVAMNLYLYGEESAAIAAQQRPIWQALLEKLFAGPAIKT